MGGRGRGKLEELKGRQRKNREKKGKKDLYERRECHSNEKHRKEMGRERRKVTEIDVCSR